MSVLTMKVKALMDLDRMIGTECGRDATVKIQRKQYDFTRFGVDLLNSEEKVSDDNNNNNNNNVDGSNSVVQILVEALHNELIVWRRGGQTRHRSHLEYSDALIVALICSALDRHLDCPEHHRLDEMLLVVKDDLIPALRAVMHIFVPWWSCDTTVRNIALSKTARIIIRITNHINTGHEELYDALVPVLQSRIAPDIRVDAACAIATLLYYLENRIVISGEVESWMISTLTTAALSASEDRLEEIVWAITYLVAFIPNTRNKIVKRRCSVLAINKLMAHPNPTIRRHALDLSLCIIANAESVVRRIGNHNLDLFLEELCMQSTCEQDPQLQVMIVKNIEPFVIQVSLRDVYFDRAMEALNKIAFSEAADDAASRAAMVFIKESRAPHSSLTILKRVFEFTTLPFAEVRKEALTTLRLAMMDSRIASSFLADQALFDNIVLIIRYGCVQDCASATALIAQLAGDKVHHRILFSNMSLLEAMVNVVVVKANSNRSAQGHALDAILSLLSNPESTSSFLAYPDLLPYLITLVNATTAEESFKEKLVRAIMTLSRAILA